MQRNWKKLISVVLSLVLLLALAVPGLAVDGEGGAQVTWEKVDNSVLPAHLNRTPYEEQADAPEYADDELVYVSIVLSDKSTIEQGFAAQGIAQNDSAMRYCSELQAKQERVAQTISRRSSAASRWTSSGT